MGKTPAQLLDIALALRSSLRRAALLLAAIDGALVRGGRRLIADVLGLLSPGLKADVVRAEVDAAYDEAGRGYGGPRPRSFLFDAALYQRARTGPIVHVN